MARIGKFFFFDGSENLATVFYYHVRSNGGVVESIGCVDNTSSFLEQSSFLLSPSGYKEDTVYTQKPIGATGNLTFTRGSDSWRTNVQGLVERTPWNIVRYSQDFENAIWSNRNSSITANIINAPNGTLTADKFVEDSTNNSHYNTQQIPNSNSLLTYSIYAKAGERTFLRINAFATLPNNFSYTPTAIFNLSNGTVETTSSCNAFIQNVGDGWYRCTMQCTSVFASTSATVNFYNYISLTDSVFSYQGDGTSGIYIWGAQLVEGAYPLEYFPTTDRLDVPRIDYSYGTCPALLLEPQRTNINTKSNDFTLGGGVWYDFNGKTPVANQGTSPDGTNNAWSIPVGSSLGTEFGKGIGGTIGDKTAASIWAKGNETAFRLYIQNVTNTDIIGTVTVNLTTGAITSGSGTVQSFNNGWYRITTIGTSTITNGYPRTIISNPNSSCLIYGSQFEQGAYPSSYIRTEATTVTRLADSFSRNNIYTNNLITSAGGTWFVELRNNIQYLRDASSYSFALKDGTDFNNGIYFRVASGTAQRISIVAYSGGTVPTGAGYIVDVNNAKIAAKWDGSTYNLFVNGSKVLSSIPFIAKVFENIQTSATRDVPIFIQQMALYPVPLDDVDCELLTNPTSSGYSSFASMASSLGYILI